VAGELFRDLSLAVAFSLLASLLVALTLLPTIAARFSGLGMPTAAETSPDGPRPTTRWGRVRWVTGRVLRAPFRGLAWLGRLGRALLVFWWTETGRVIGRAAAPLLDSFDRGFSRFADRYHRVLEWSLDHRARVLGISALALTGALALGWTLPRDLLPEVDQGAFEIRLVLAEGTGLEATASAAREIETQLLGDPGVEAVFGQVGRDVRAYAEGQEETGLNTARFQVRLREGVGTDEVLERVRDLAGRFPSGTLAFQSGQATALGAMLGGSDADVSVRVRGEDLELMMVRAEEVRGRLARLPMLGNVRVGSDEGTPQIQVEILREQAARYGIAPRLIAETLDRAMRGDRATEFVDFDRKIGVVVRYPRDQRYPRDAGVVPCARRADPRTGGRARGARSRRDPPRGAGAGDSGLRRRDPGGARPGHHVHSRRRLALADLPPTRELRMEVGGENEEMRRSFRDLGFAFALALMLVYMILAAQFESFVHPFTILTAVPLALVGAILALAVTRGGLNTMSLIGVVILVGIVVNDAIVKVDFINQARRQGMACVRRSSRRGACASGRSS
jgi:hydrophobic/amphiphilic exporter-1 (mainly G- bacteria), HAE1 family